MLPWKVTIEGRNAVLPDEGGSAVFGVYVVLHLEALDEAAAGALALEQVSKELKNRVLNQPDDAPVLMVESVEALTSLDDFREKPPTFSFYADNVPRDSAPFESKLPIDESFALARGVSLTDRGGLTAGYSVTEARGGEYSTFLVNVGAAALADTYITLANLIAAPGFFILEVGTNRAVEEELRESPDDPLHVDIHYLDGMATVDHTILFNAHAELLSNCGMLSFGFGSHEGVDEVTVDGYKVVRILSKTPAKYVVALESLGIPMRADLRTAWDTLSEETPGERHSVRVDGKSVYDLVEELTGRGLYFAKRRTGTV